MPLLLPLLAGLFTGVLALHGQTGAPALEAVSELVVAPGRMCFTPDGREIMSLHPFYTPKNRVVEIAKNGTLRPFPNAELNGIGDAHAASAPAVLDAVLGLQCDAAGTVWLLDAGLRSGGIPKLVAWDTRAEKLARLIYLPPPATIAGSFLNGLAVDAEHGAIYLSDSAADAASSALVVVDIATGLARRILEGDKSVTPEEEADVVLDGAALTQPQPDGGTPAPLRAGATPLALDAAHEWLYFGPLNGTSLYRIRTKDLANPFLNDRELSHLLERYSGKPVGGSIALDAAGNIYASDIAAHAVGMIRADDRSYSILASDARLLWPDGLTLAPDGGSLFFVANQLHRSPRMNGSENLSEPPFSVFRLKLPGLAAARAAGEQPAREPRANR